MLAKYEQRFFTGTERIWVGSYRNLNNIAHWHMESELIYCAEGSANVTLNSRHYKLQKGVCLLCEEGSIHQINSDENSLLWVCLCSGEILLNVTKERRLEEVLFEDKYHVKECLFQIQKELYSKNSYYGEKANALFLSMMIDIFRGEKTVRQEASVNILPPSKYRELLSWIDRECTVIRFEDAASYMNLSPPYFSRYFKKLSGLTFSEYLNAVKVEKAIAHLQKNPKISSIELMEKCGFNTIRNMNRVFKKLTNYAPKQLPSSFKLHIQTHRSEGEQFDPTLENSILL